jgi:hypothetical protein
MVAIAAPNLLTDPGRAYYAVGGTALPANTVAAGAFTDAWPIAWLPIGMTTDGTEVHPSVTVAPITAAEQIDPIAYRTTDRATTVQLALMNFTATMLSYALNGAAKVVTGATTTTLTTVTPPQPGLELRYMFGWESVNLDVRFFAFQTINSGDLSINLKKAPSTAGLALTLNLEYSATYSAPFQWAFAGTQRG